MPYHLHPELRRSPQRAAPGIAHSPPRLTGTPNAVLTAHASLGVSMLNVPVDHAADAARPRCSVPLLPAHSPSKLLRRYCPERHQERRHRCPHNTAEWAVAVL
jgi:hypothetical protein